MTYLNQPAKITTRYGLAHTHTQLLHTTVSRNVITYCKLQFAHHSAQDELITDNGPQFTSGSFWSFSLICKFKNTTSKYSYAQEKESVLEQKPSNSLPPHLQVCHQHQCKNRDAHLTALLASPDLRLIGKRKVFQSQHLTEAGWAERLLTQEQLPKHA